jgi:hypothetical protein
MDDGLFRYDAAKNQGNGFGVEFFSPLLICRAIDRISRQVQLLSQPLITGWKAAPGMVIARSGPENFC